MRKTLLYLLLLSAPVFCFGQSAKDEAKMADCLKQFFSTYKVKDMRLPRQYRMLSYQVDNDEKTISITADEWFGMQGFTPEVTEQIYKKIKGDLPKPYNKYKVSIISNGINIEELIPNRLSKNADKSRLWGNINYDGEPWVKNISTPFRPTHGLQNRHLSLWASHGRYYDQKTSKWRWQRPKLFATTEDLFTQTIVVPYLIPMLERAGAIVFTPRERDWQTEEIIVDNDGPKNNYIEVTAHGKWQTTQQPGFMIRGMEGGVSSKFVWIRMSGSRSAALKLPSRMDAADIRFVRYTIAVPLFGQKLSKKFTR